MKALLAAAARIGTRFAAALSCAVWMAAPLSSQAAPPQRPDRSARSAAELMDVVMWNREPIGGPFQLLDQHGRMRRDSDFRGRFMLVYFGFTTCPDVCPTDLMQIGLAMQDLGTRAGEVAPLFITLDPGRDTVRLLSQYVPAFHPSIIGLTGSAAEIRRVAEAYRVYWARVPVKGALRYTVDHSSFIYLMGRDGEFLGFLPPGSPSERIVAVLRQHLGPAGR